jgi:DNA-binding CsgD family transcriptional regulator
VDGLEPGHADCVLDDAAVLTYAEDVGRLIGRDVELERLNRFLDVVERPGARAMAIVGEPGIGKTALWEESLEVARTNGYAVLTSRAIQAETNLSFAALRDLVDGVGPAALARLPAPQLNALEVALRLAEPAASPPDSLAIAAGLLTALNAVAERQPLLVAVDDVQWLDDASMPPILFTLRRLRSDNARVLLSRLEETPSQLEKALERGVERLELAGLSIGAIGRLLSERLGLVLSRRELRHLYETTHGNPLFAIELGRSVAGKKDVEVGSDLPMPRIVEELFGSRLRELPDQTRHAVLAVALSADVTHAELSSVVDPLALEDAIASGLLVADGPRVRPAHPLLAIASRHEATAHQRRDTHLALSSAFTDDALRVRHLAMATAVPNDELAASVAAASEKVLKRGDVREAELLAGHALRLTPHDAPARPERVLRLAGRYFDVGDIPRMEALLTAEIEAFTSPVDRVQGHLLLAQASVNRTNEEEHVASALTEAGSDPELRASALGLRIRLLATAHVERLDLAEDLASEALESASHVGSEAVAQMMGEVAWIRLLRGGALEDNSRTEVLPSSGSIAADAALARAAGLARAFRGEVRPARAIFERLRADTLESGQFLFVLLSDLHLCELALRAGDIHTATRELEQLSAWDFSIEHSIIRARMHALIEAVVGAPLEVDRWVRVASEVATESQLAWDTLELRRASGIAALCEQDSERAVKELGSVWEHTVREQVLNPGVFPVAADFVEALVLTKDGTRASAVIDTLRRRSIEQDHPWGLATTTRCDAVLALADRYDDGAAASLREAATAYENLGLHFDHARSLLALGRAERRYKKSGAARASLAMAAEIFDQSGSTGWADLARAELARVSGRRREDEHELTPSEQQVASLAATGMSNKEIAARLYVSVNTVETHLRHVYAKLGVRSRSQLAQRWSSNGPARD